MSAWAIVVAAGDGTRLGAQGPKALVKIAGRTMLEWSIDAAAAASISGLVVACGAGWLDRCEQIVGARGLVCAGGDSRHASVRAALDLVPPDAGRVVIHDAARPFASAGLFERALAALDGASGAICAVSVTDTIKRCEGDVVQETVDRSRLRRAQTPQAFRTDDLRAAIAAAGDDQVTDEAVLLERAGMRVVVVAGDERNLKITTAADMDLARAMAGR